MNTADLTSTMVTLFRELMFGTDDKTASVLNPGDAGLLESIDRLSAADASRAPAAGAPIAAHVDHLRYGLSLMNRWADGENPFEDADWTVAWQTKTVSDDEWAELRQALRAEADAWVAVLGSPREISAFELNGVVGSIVHLGYHLGAMRQIVPAMKGPTAEASVGQGTAAGAD